jgi:hypothetical protein
MPRNQHTHQQDLQQDLFDPPIQPARIEQKDALKNNSKHVKPVKGAHKDPGLHNREILKIIKHKEPIEARNPARTVLKDEILKIVLNQVPMKATQIAALLTLRFGEEISKHEVNSILYSNNGLGKIVHVRLDDHKVELKNAPKAKFQQRIIARPATPKFRPAPIGVPLQPIAHPIPQATGGVVDESKRNARRFIGSVIGLGCAFLAFELIKLVLN